MEELNNQADISASEDEDDDKKHLKLLDAITSLDGKRRQKLFERTVHASQISEFNFSQNDSNKVNISELLGTVSSKSMKKQLKHVEEKGQVVSVPLPRQEKEKLERSVAYEQTSEVLKKWDSIVNKNRQADQMKFPLDRPTLKVHTTESHAKSVKPRTSLEMEVAALLRSSENVVSNKRELTPAEEKALQAMSIEEAKERLAELRKHRALLSYKEAKAKWQKRIKSKKYHRVLKKERMKNEKKSLEELQKTDPEAYMEKINTVDKQRVEERMSLKHRGGSKFMRKQMIYGKYSDKARQSVQDMIQKNKELTQKTEVFSDSDSDGGVSMDSEDEINMIDSAMASSDNPWMKALSLPRPTGYEKVEEIRNEDEIDVENEELENEKQFLMSNVVQKVIIEDKDNDDVTAKNFSKTDVSDEDSISEEVELDTHVQTSKPSEGEMKVDIDNIDDLFKEFENNQKKTVKNTKLKTIHEKIMGGDEQKLTRQQKKNKKKHEKKKLKKKQKKESTIEDGESDEREQCKNEEKEIDSAEEEETFIVEKRERKMNLEDFENDMSDTDNVFKTVNKRKPKIESGKGKSNNKRNCESMSGEGKQFQKEKDLYVDPKKLLTLESKLDKSNIPNIVEDDNDIDEDAKQRMTIAQAFADDDVVAEFAQEKKSIVNRDKPKDIDLTLPGWGEWGGTGVKMSKRKKKRFIIKAPPGPPRKDSNLGNVIISEQKDVAISKYQVSDLPFPYTNVKQFEESIRAPIGKTWNTEMAYKQLVKPKVVTKLGSIISPIDKEETFKKEKMKRKAENDLRQNSDGLANSKNRKRK